MDVFSNFRKKVLNRSLVNPDPIPRCTEVDNKKRELRRRIEDINAQEKLERECDSFSDSWDNL